MFISGSWGEVYFRRRYPSDRGIFEFITFTKGHEWGLILGPIRVELARN